MEIDLKLEVRDKGNRPGTGALGKQKGNASHGGEEYNKKPRFELSKKLTILISV